MGSRLKNARGGGINHLHRLLGMRNDDVISTDAVFVSLDLEVDEWRKKLCTLNREPKVGQIGFATLDTRDIRRSSPYVDIRSLISVRFYEVIGSNQRNSQCDLTPIRIRQKDVVSTITKHLRVRDESEAARSRPVLRNIVMVGHSPGYDLSFIRKLGIDIASIAPVMTILDTHSMSRCLFYPYCRLLPVAHGDDFSLAGLLARFEYRPARDRFHNAANDAEYTLHALLLMAIKSGKERRQEMSPAELGRLWKLKKIIPWWKDSEEYPVRLSEGLRDVATRVLIRQADDDYDGSLLDCQPPPLF
ncbi:hypothetical protein PG993_006464 [Apiospora rasikravindrae]|uniref:Gfd2/YDR514C-like C-terminal domain-containing protein n=1 Tax=Apiospora rasikravindrae TaxID=990691 RepID=A0ABR1T5R9_9PEZI